SRHRVEPDRRQSERAERSGEVRDQGAAAAAEELNAVDISLTKLPWYAQIGAFVLLAGAGVTTFYYYYELPLSADMAARESQLQAIVASNDKGYATAKKLDEFRRQVADLQTRLDSIRAVLPEE